jgi:16S rRNA G966 N2-methylase RsmD
MEMVEEPSNVVEEKENENANANVNAFLEEEEEQQQQQPTTTAIEEEEQQQQQPYVKKKTKFYLHAKQLYLVYTDCPFSKEKALEMLQQIIPISKYCIVEEGSSLYCYLKCATKARTRNKKKFDLVEGGVVCHGEYKTCRGDSVVSWRCKEGNFIEKE